MTDVVVQDLMSDRKVTIKCKDYVKKIAIYRDRLAIQLKNKVHILELLQQKVDIDNDDSEEELQYRIIDKIFKDIECNLMVVTFGHLIFCHEKELHMYDFKGNLQRVWELDSSVKYVKIVGGPPFKEALLVGLANGAIFKVFVDNPFPVQLLKHDHAIRGLDLNMTRRKLALVDQNNDLMVYDLKEKKYVYQEKNADGVAWNSEHDNMLCYSGGGMLNIKTDNFPVNQHKLQGLVVGFTGSKVFCLHQVAMSTIDIPQSATLYKYIEKADFQEAYKISCLGVTETDWRHLGIQSLLGVNLEIARKCFNRIEDTKFISLIDKYERTIKQNQFNRDLFVAEIHAYQGKFDEAAKMFVKGGRADLALDMLCDLRKWKEAKELAVTYDNINLTDMIIRQAKTAEEDNDWKVAAELYAAAGLYDKAVQIMGDNKWFDMLIELCKNLNPNEVRGIAMCAEYFRKNKMYDAAKDAYQKIGDFSSLIKLFIAGQKWEQAFEVSTQNLGLMCISHMLSILQLRIDSKKHKKRSGKLKSRRRPKRSLSNLHKMPSTRIDSRTPVTTCGRLLMKLWLIQESNKLPMVCGKKSKSLKSCLSLAKFILHTTWYTSSLSCLSTLLMLGIFSMLASICITI